ncbi:MAG: hypothetical protein MHPSP_004280, partial [Paramarteilia canceri]
MDRELLRDHQRFKTIASSTPTVATSTNNSYNSQKHDNLPPSSGKFSTLARVVHFLK